MDIQIYKNRRKNKYYWEYNYKQVKLRYNIKEWQRKNKKNMTKCYNVNKKV